MKLINQTIIWLFLVSLFSIMGCGSAEVKPQFIPVSNGQSYGFIDETGRLVIDYQFAYAMPFGDTTNIGWSLAAVNIGGTPDGKHMPTNGKWGFIDENGSIIINPLFYSPPIIANPFNNQELALVMHDGYIFSEGLAAVYTSANEWVYIDKYGRTIISGMDIASARRFKEGLAAVYINGKWGYINRRGQIEIEPKYLFPVDFKDGLAMVMTPAYQLRIIDRQGEELYTQQRITQLFEDSIAVYKPNYKGEDIPFGNEFTYGIIDLKGNFKGPSHFDQVGRYGNRLAPVLIGSKATDIREFPEQITLTENTGGKWGYADKRGIIRINPVFEQAKGFSEGLAAVKMEGDWGFIDTEGQWVIKPGFRRTSYFEDGMCEVTLGIRFNQYFNKRAFIDRSGDIIWIEP